MSRTSHNKTPLPYTVDHNGFRCLLSPEQPPFYLSRALWPLLGALLTTVWLLSRGAFGLWSLVGILAALSIAALAVLLRGVDPPARFTEIACDHRTMRITERRGERVLSQRSIPLLDLHKAGASGDGWLVIDPKPGPLQPVTLDARGTDHAYLPQIATAINEAIAHAERFRGDRPDALSHAVEHLLARESER